LAIGVFGPLGIIWALTITKVIVLVMGVGMWFAHGSIHRPCRGYA
jgi:hypothetical protein